jgi:prepilin-type N-terminal cleavage/methylation domain-containing protein
MCHKQINAHNPLPRVDLTIDPYIKICHKQINAHSPLPQVDLTIDPYTKMCHKQINAHSPLPRVDLTIDPYIKMCHGSNVGADRQIGPARNRLKGFSLIELLVVIALSALLFSISTFSYQFWLTQQQVQFDAQRVMRTLNMAREMAMLRGESITTIIGHELVIKNAEHTLQHFTSSKHNDFIIRAFPHSTDNAFTFLRNGYTATQNASIYICPQQHKQFAQKVVINQGGRIYVSDENAEAYC